MGRFSPIGKGGPAMGTTWPWPQITPKEPIAPPWDHSSLTQNYASITFTNYVNTRHPKKTDGFDQTLTILALVALESF
eukprot:433021-Pelagomonas_calceolata.AAC.3